MGTIKASVRDYYDLNPPGGHLPGDIWSGLPAFGTLGEGSIFGMVISPACDLVNRKAETIIYLPILPVLTYFSTLGVLPEIKRAINGLLQNLSMDDLIEWPDGMLPPEERVIALAEKTLGESRDRTQNPKKRELITRVLAGVRVLRCIADPRLVEVPASDLSILLAKDWKSIKERLVTNSWRSDLHFLPADDQQAVWSGVPVHSVICFRYVFTLPADLLDYAQDPRLPAWSGIVSRFQSFMPCAAALGQERPMKRISVKPRFLADIMTRFLALFIRLGSPDFSPGNVQHFCQEIGE